VLDLMFPNKKGGLSLSVFFWERTSLSFLPLISGLEPGSGVMLSRSGIHGAARRKHRQFNRVEE
jgi:hypothetical protein